MDPFSVALGVISVATAVKDIAELGQKIHESFAKVSDNFRNAQRVAEDIKEMVEEIEAFCEAHKDGLDNMKYFRVALQGLLGKLRSFEASVLPLLPQTGERRRYRLIRGWNAWRNNNNIERSILDLQSDIMKVMRQFVWKSTMRTEVKLETIHQETKNDLICISERLQAIEESRKNVSTLRATAGASTTRGPFETLGTTGSEFKRNIILFAQSTSSTSVPMLRSPDVITEELMTAAYIKFQINAIATTLGQMSVLPTFDVATDDSMADFDLVIQLEEGSMNLTHLRRHVVRKVTEIRDLLDNRHLHTIPIYDGSLALNQLAYGLDVLGMGHEALVVGEWAITLARMLANASDRGQPDSAVTLALHLLNQSKRYSNGGDMSQAEILIKEAHSISQKLQNQTSDVYIHLLHAKVLYQLVILADCQHSIRIRMLIEGITILEKILGVQAFIYHELEANISLVVKPTSSFFDDLFSSVLTTAIDDYAHVLRTLARMLFIDNHQESGLDLARLAVAICRGLVSIHGPEWGASLALTLLFLVQGEAAKHIPAQELVDITDECIQLLRELAEKNPLRYAANLVEVLSKKATTLESLNQDDEAIATWEEAVNVAEQITQHSAMCAYALAHLSDNFRRLQRYDDAVRTRKLAITTHHDVDKPVQAAMYYNLSGELRQLHRFDEAVEAARTSVALYRRLTMSNPTVTVWMGNLIGALYILARGLVALSDYPEVLITWGESASILENFLNADSGTSYSDSFVTRSCMALEGYAYISGLLKNEEDCYQVSSMAFRYSQRLSEVYPHNADIIDNLWEAQWRCSYNMVVVGRFQDADQYMNYWLNMWSEGPTVAPDSKRVEWHACMTTLKSHALYLRGCTEEALLMTQKARSIASLSTSTPLVCFSMIDSMTLEAQMQLDIGNSKEALQVAEKTLRLCRDHKQELNDCSFILSLHTVAVVALLCQDYARSIEAAQEGCDICGTTSWQDDEDEFAFVRPSLLAILSSAEANLGRFGAAVEYARRAVEASLGIGEKKWAVPPLTAKASYMETRGNLAEILIATDELTQAREICEERRAYFSKRVEKRMGEYRDLAPILRMLGVLCCAEGRHEEGEAAAQELSRIVKTLGCAFPSLQEQVKIRLRRQAEVPILEVLNKMTRKLDCKHQAEVSSLYEIVSMS